MKPQKVAIIGLGLIGGSIGMSLVQSKAIPSVTGWDALHTTRGEALHRHAVHQAPDRLEDAVAGADLIIVATPIRQVCPTVEKIVPFLKSGAVLTDVASTKGEIALEILKMLPSNVEYIGGHPMAGSEGHGIEAADPYLFENAVYILAPTERSGETASSVVLEVLRLIGAQPLVLDPDEHDRMVAAVSHLPHIAAAMVAGVAGELDKSLPGTLSLAAGGFRDTTRVAMSPPSLWAEIVFSNRKHVLEMLERIQEELSGFKVAILEQDEEAFKTRFGSSGEVRRQVPQKNKGFARMLHEMVVRVQDRPGEIAGVVNLLAGAEINIKDIEILRVREGEGGTLRLAVEDEESQASAIRVLTSEGYQVYPK